MATVKQAETVLKRLSQSFSEQVPLPELRKALSDELKSTDLRVINTTIKSWEGLHILESANAASTAYTYGKYGKELIEKQEPKKAGE